MDKNNRSFTSQASQTDDETLDELMKQYASEGDIQAAVREKEENEGFEEVGVTVKSYPVVQCELDLHGFSVPEGLFELERFITQSLQHRLRTVRVITGKGLHSKNMISVMPEEIEKKLAHLKREAKVFAFRREKTGGSFAVYLIS